MKQIDEKVKQEFKSYCDSQSWCRFNRFSNDPYARWDVSYYSADTHGNEISVIGEIKSKDKYPSTFTNDWLLSVDKYEALEVVKAKAIEKDPTQQYAIQYINIHCDSIIRIWTVDNIRDRKPICYMDLPTTTYFTNGTRKEIPVYYCKVDEAIVNTNITLINK